MARLEFNIVRQITTHGPLPGPPNTANEAVNIKLEVKDEMMPDALAELHDALTLSAMNLAALSQLSSDAQESARALFQNLSARRLEHVPQRIEHR